MVRTPKAGFYQLIGIPGIIILAVLFLVPLAVVLSEAFVSDQGTITFSRIIGLTTDPYIFKVLAFTLYQAAVSTVISIVIAIPGAYMLSSYNFTGKRLVSAICMIPFVLPSILVVLGFVIFYGNNGMINVFLMKIFRLEEPPLKILYSFKAIILAHAFYNFPLAIGIIASYWERLGTSLGHAAATLGAKRFTIFRTITLARLVPAIISAASLIFLFCFSSFAIMLVLGGGPQFTTMEVEIYRRARVMLDTGGAAALSLISIAVAIILVAIYSWTQRVLARQEEVSISDRSSSRHKRPIRSIWVKLANLGYILLMIVFVLGPLASIIVRSFQASETRTGAYT
ncbi:MAG: iron ABC transporter permease, partial [Spirochaetales bacterium]|nr:iron ABC transporter permease [Spirochaetales bacterium]